MSKYRYAIDADGTITRGEIVRIGDTESWRDYWDGDGMVGFTITYRNGSPTLDMLAEDSDNERAVAAWQSERSGTRGSDGALDRLAVRLGTSGNEEIPASCFMQINLDRDIDLIVHSFSGDNREWRDEIEAVWHGEVYRIVADKQIGTVNGYDPLWLEDESDCTEYYGEDNAADELARQFPLDEYPAEVVVSSDGS